MQAKPVELPESPTPDGIAHADAEQRLRLLLDSLADHAVFLIDLSGMIQSWNTGVRRVLGYEQADFVGLPFAALFTPETWPRTARRKSSNARWPPGGLRTSAST
jgi:PAS domain S-box-containing protein